MKTRQKKKAADPEAQIKRFKEMARELGADESQDALDKAFKRLDPRRSSSKPKDEK
jgi:hypothetical protein